MTQRPALTPPAHAPDLAPAVLSPALHKSAGTRAIGDRGRFWWALAWPALLCGPLGIAAWQAVGAWPAQWGMIGWLTGIGGGVLGLRIWWVGLTFIQDVRQLRYQTELWGIQLDTLKLNAAAERAALDQYSTAVYGPVPVVAESPVAVLTHRARQQTDAATVAQAAAARSEAAAEGVIELLADWGRARVPAALEYSAAAALPDAPDTVQLGHIPLAGYVGSDCEALVSVALGGAPPTGRYFAAQGWTRPRYAAARDRLVAARVLGLPALKGAAVGLTPAFAQAAGDHALAAQWLSEVGEGAIAPSPSPANTLGRAGTESPE